MLSTWLSVIGIVMTTGGTILTLWSVITIKIEDVGEWRTAGGQDDGAMQKAMYKPKPFTICGSVVIVFGAATQIIALFV